MKIRFLSGPKKGETTHAPVTQQTQLLVDAGLVEVIPPEPLAPATVSWAVKYDSFGTPMIAGSCSRGCGMFRYLGKPDFANRYFFQHSGCGNPTPVPFEVIERYREAYGSATPSGNMDDAKLADARQIGGRIDAAADAQFAKVYGRPRRY